MSYTPNTWVTGDTVTAEKLNNIESGIENTNIFYIHLNPTAQDMSGTMDETPAEILAAVSAGNRIYGEIVGLNGIVVFTQFLEIPDTGVSCVGQFLYNVGGQDMLVNVMTSATNQTYTTGLFPLTPLS